MRILFQGDSITDSGRARNKDSDLGTGYPMLIKASLGMDHPQKYEFFNRGVGGDRIPDLYARMKADILHLKPDVLSILIGVNDVWHELAPIPNGVDANKFFMIYSLLIEEIKMVLPQIKIMILEPFALPGSGTNEQWEYFIEEIQKRAAMSKKVAETYGLMYVELQAGLNALTEKAPASEWLADGVHPTPMGHEYIKRQWCRAFEML